MDNSSPIVQTGLIETIKTSLQPESVAQKFGLNKHTLLDVGVYGAIGFIAGYLIKKYSEYFISLVLLLVILVVLQQYDYISLSINSVKIHEALGLQDMPMAGDGYGALLYEWMHSHVVSSSSLIVGFLIGLKVG